LSVDEAERAMIREDQGRGGLLRLIYASRFTGAERDFDEVLRAVIAKSIQNNRLDDVTGFLVAGEGRFLQLLEGPVAAVEAVYARIGRDPRHADLALIHNGHAERRLFRDWNMGQHRIGEADRTLLAEAGLSSFDPASLDADAAEKLLTTAGGRHLR
jgi:hypothetical protein